MTAPVSVHTACTNIRLPVPRGPASIIDLISGPFSCTAGDPEGNQFNQDIFLRMYHLYSVEYVLKGAPLPPSS